MLPFDVFVDVGHADIVVGFAQIEQPIRRRLYVAVGRDDVELLDDAARRRRDESHDFGLEQQCVLRLDHLMIDGVLYDRIDDRSLEVPVRFDRVGGRRQSEQIQQTVQHVKSVHRRKG